MQPRGTRSQGRVDGPSLTVGLFWTHETSAETLDVSGVQAPLLLSSRPRAWAARGRSGSAWVSSPRLRALEVPPPSPLWKVWGLWHISTWAAKGARGASADKTPADGGPGPAPALRQHCRHRRAGLCPDQPADPARPVQRHFLPFRPTWLLTDRSSTIWTTGRGQA